MVVYQPCKGDSVLGKHQVWPRLRLVELARCAGSLGLHKVWLQLAWLALTAVQGVDSASKSCGRNLGPEGEGALAAVTLAAGIPGLATCHSSPHKGGCFRVGRQLPANVLGMKGITIWRLVGSASGRPPLSSRGGGNQT